MSGLTLNGTGLSLIPPVAIAAAVGIASTTISGGTTTRVLFDNAGVLGEYAISGTGSVAMTTSPVFVTPALGAATATSLAATGDITTSGGNIKATGGAFWANNGSAGSPAFTWLADNTTGLYLTTGPSTVNFSTAGAQRGVLNASGLLMNVGLLSSSSSQGIGYATGAGGTVTQGAGSGKATTVVLNTVCGTITMNGAALASVTSVAFTFTNSAIAATDSIDIQHDSVGTLGGYNVVITPGAGTATVTVRNTTAGSLSEAIVLRFFVKKAVVS